MDHELPFIDNFIEPSRRDRYRLKLGSPKHRKEFLSCLYHNLDFLPELSARFEPSEQTWQIVLGRLRSLGAPDMCYCISTKIETDRATLLLEQALQDMVGLHQGYILSCIPGKLAYYESEDRGGRYVLYRP
jgi:hypothetical protein